MNAERAELNPIMMVHDELVCHVKEGAFLDPLAELDKCLLRAPAWAKGLPLAAEGWTGKRYKK